MRSSLVVVLCLVGLLSGGFLVLEETGAGSPPDQIVVEQVHANLVRVRIHGQWENFPLMPLADHLCQSNNRLFDRYCGDDVISPESR
ncbi:hypothetical protein ACFL6C_12905 [Myxococcota bacterium]